MTAGMVRRQLTLVVRWAKVQMCLFSMYVRARFLFRQMLDIMLHDSIIYKKNTLNSLQDLQKILQLYNIIKISYTLWTIVHMHFSHMPDTCTHCTGMCLIYYVPNAGVRCTYSVTFLQRDICMLICVVQVSCTTATPTWPHPDTKVPCWYRSTCLVKTLSCVQPSRRHMPVIEIILQYYFRTSLCKNDLGRVLKFPNFIFLFLMHNFTLHVSEFLLNKSLT